MLLVGPWLGIVEILLGRDRWCPGRDRAPLRQGESDVELEAAIIGAPGQAGLGL